MHFIINKLVRKTALIYALTCLFILLPNVVSASVIFSQGFDPFSFNANGSSDFGSNNQKADDFSITSNDVLRSVSWQGIYQGGPGAAPVVDDFTVRIFADNSTPGLPGSLIYEENIMNVVNRSAPVNSGSTFGLDLFTYDANLASSVNLTSGVIYWLSIVNNVGTSPTANDSWAWAASSTSGSAASRSLDTDPWNNNNATLQFQLTNVPIPAAIWLLSSALLGLAFFKRNNNVA